MALTLIGSLSLSARASRPGSGACCSGPVPRMTTMVLEATMMPMRMTGTISSGGPPLLMANSPSSTMPHQKARIIPLRARALARTVLVSGVRVAISAGADFLQLGVPLAGDDRTDEGGPEIPHRKESHCVVHAIDLKVELWSHETRNPSKRNLADRNIKANRAVLTAMARVAPPENSRPSTDTGCCLVAELSALGSRVWASGPSLRRASRSVAMLATTPMIEGMMNSGLPMNEGATKNMAMNAQVPTSEMIRMRPTRAGAGVRSGAGERLGVRAISATLGPVDKGDVGGWSLDVLELCGGPSEVDEADDCVARVEAAESGDRGRDHCSTGGPQ